MADRATSPDRLSLLLERARLPQAGATFSADVTQAQIDALLGRIALLTEALRGAPDTEDARLASRLLLSDLALVEAQLRARANELAAGLSRARDGLRAALDNTDVSDADEHID